MKSMPIRQALQNVADNPVMLTDEILQIPVHELIARELFAIANRPDANQRGSMARANKARKMILDRLVGRRRAGTHPAARTTDEIEFIALGTEELS